MFIRNASTLLLLALLLLAGCNTGTVRKDSTAATPEEKAYAALLERAKNSDPALDFREMRVLYSRTPAYSPVPGDNPDFEAMNEAFEADDNEKALKYASRVLEQNYVDLDAHLISMSVHERMGNTEKQQHHTYMINGLLGSILDSGDGKSPGTAFEVITVREEYIVLIVFGLDMKEQSTVEADGHMYDQLEVVEPETGRSGMMYFNVDIPFAGYEKMLGGQ